MYLINFVNPLKIYFLISRVNSLVEQASCLLLRMLQYLRFLPHISSW